MSGGGKGGGKSVVIGYRYFHGVQLGVCHGAVDTIRRIIIGEREAFNGAKTYPADTTFNINKPELFGGDSREGGVAGNIDILWGNSTQARNAYLAAHQGADCPAYRGIFSLVFKAFMWSSGNPYFKAPWVDFTRIKQGWRDDTCWYPTKAEIVVAAGEPPDMNPAHIIYQCLTDVEWGMGYNYADIDEPSFMVAADTLFAENFGLSLMWDQQSDLDSFIQTVLDHVEGGLRLDLSTGKFVLKLHRGGYDVNTLTNLNVSNVLEMKSFQRAGYGEFANEVVLSWKDRDGNDKPVAVQDLASVQAQGSVVSTSRSYPGIRHEKLAARVAMRDLRLTCSPLAKASITTNRVLFNHERGDVVSLTWPDRNITLLPMRIVKIEKGSHQDGRVDVELVEDVFSLPGSAYTSSAASQWADPITAPSPADAAMPIEAPYWDVVHRMTKADMDYLTAGYGFGSVLATEGALTVTPGFKLAASPDNVAYSDIADVQFCPTGLLAANISATQTSFTLSAAFDLDQVLLAADGGYCYVGTECCSVVSVDPSTGGVTVGRGILDTTPVPHPLGTRVYFTSEALAYDLTERTSGETVYYKVRTKTGIGTLPVADAPVETLVLANRASRPYPPGNFKVNGLSYPALVAGPEITATWAHRDRLAQTVSFIDHTVGNVGPEPGTTYRMRVYNGNTLLRTYEIAGGTLTWSYPTDHSVADGSLSTVRLVLTSVRDGLESYQACDHTVSRSTVSGGVYHDTPPAAPTITATGVNFAIQLNWVFGDLRTNILHTEIWASATPTFADGATLRYEPYAGTSYLHEISDVGAYRWYWARVADVDGNLSAWSPVSWARSGFSTSGVPDVASLPATPDPGVEVVRLTTDNMIYVWSPSTSTWRTAVNASDIQGLIIGSQIAANTITADKMSVASLAAVSAAMGSITSGNITLDSAGFIRGGSTGYLTGAGFWMGYHSGLYKFHIGDPAGSYFAWTGTGISLSGASVDVSTTGNVRGGQTDYATGTGFFLGYSGSAYKFSIGNATNYIRWDGTTMSIGGSVIATGNIVDGAVTNSQGITDSTPATFAAGVWTSVLSQAITTIGNKVLVSVSARTYALPNGWNMRILRGATEIFTTVVVDGGTTYFLNLNTGMVSVSIIDQPPAGTYTYYLQLWMNTGAGGGKVGFRTIALTEMKK